MHAFLGWQEASEHSQAILTWAEAERVIHALLSHAHLPVTPERLDSWQASGGTAVLPADASARGPLLARCAGSTPPADASSAAVETSLFALHC